MYKKNLSNRFFSLGSDIKDLKVENKKTKLKKNVSKLQKEKKSLKVKIMIYFNIEISELY